MTTWNIEVPPQINHKELYYRIGNEIGRGGYGIVYECRDDWDNDLVAKLVVPQQGDTTETVYARWMDEIQKLMLLRHPNITFLHDAFFCEGHFYLIIEKCDLTLWQILNNPAIPKKPLIFPIARCILQAIDFIHKNGYVHKDLHPGNVFATFIKDDLHPDNRNAVTFKVGDLGISRLVKDINVFNTILAPWMLPPEYLSPESFGVVGPATDIYHAGLTLLSFVVGQTLTFTNDQILNGHPMKYANTFGEIGKLLANALNPHVEARYQTALEFWKDIKELRVTKTI